MFIEGAISEPLAYNGKRYASPQLSHLRALFGDHVVLEACTGLELPPEDHNLQTIKKQCERIEAISYV